MYAGIQLNVDVVLVWNCSLLIGRKLVPTDMGKWPAGEINASPELFTAAYEYHEYPHSHASGTFRWISNIGLADIECIFPCILQRRLLHGYLYFKVEW